MQSRYYNPEMGRFISADSYASTGQGVLGYNMFAYCNNNPITYVDSSGERLERYEPIASFGGLITVPIIGGITFVDTLAEHFDDVTQKIKNSLSKIDTHKTYKSPYEEHHITAKTSYKADAARAVLIDLFPEGTESPFNKITLKTALHRRIHNNLYYAATNILVVQAYNSAEGNKEIARSNVISTLTTIGGILKGLEVFIPY